MRKIVLALTAVAGLAAIPAHGEPAPAPTPTESPSPAPTPSPSPTPGH